MSEDLIRLQKEVVMLLTILVKRGEVQASIIKQMGEVGFGPKRISELLNTSSNTVSVTLNKSNKNRKQKGRKK